MFRAVIYKIPTVGLSLMAATDGPDESAERLTTVKYYPKVHTHVPGKAGIGSVSSR